MLEFLPGVPDLYNGYHVCAVLSGSNVASVRTILSSVNFDIADLASEHFVWRKWRKQINGATQ